MTLATVNTREPLVTPVKDTGSQGPTRAISQYRGQLVNAVSDFLALQAAKGRAPKTIRNYRQELTRWATFCQARGIETVDQYRLSDHAVYITSLQNRGLKGGTIDLTNTLIKVFTKRWAKDGLVPRDPLEDFDRQGSEKPLPKALPWELVEEHIRLVKSRYAIVVARDRFLIRLISYTGLRPGEALALRRADVDLDKRQLRLLGTKGREATWQPYPDKFQPFLEEWMMAAAARWTASEWLVPSRTGKRLRLREVQASFKSYGIATPHVYRHTYGTFLLEQGASIREVQEMLRHKNIQTTVRYLKVFDSKRRALANLVK